MGKEQSFGGGRWSGDTPRDRLTGATSRASTLIEKALIPSGSWEEGDQENVSRDRFYDRAAESQPLRKRLKDE